MSDIMKALKKRATEIEMSQVDIAERLGVTTVTICRWFKGEREPSIEYVEKLALILGLRVCLKYEGIIGR